MSTQKAVVLHDIGKPVVLVNDRPIPQPGPDQVLLKVKVAALNPHDQKIRDEGLIIQGRDMLPWVAASDVVGSVSALGNNTSNHFNIGDRVMYFGSVTDTKSTQSGLQQYALADIGSTICRIPGGLSDDGAATIPTNITSVFVALFIMLGIKAPWEKEGEVPEHLLIVGGGSNCGRFAVQLARLAGIKTIITIGGNESELKAYGATHVLNRHADEAEIVQQVKAITNDELVYAFDTVNQPNGLAPGFSALSSKKKGALARLIPRGVIGDDVKKGHKLVEIMAAGPARDPPSLSMWSRLSKWIQKGDIKPLGYSVAGSLNAEAVNEALDKYRDGRSTGQPHIQVS